MSATATATTEFLQSNHRCPVTDRSTSPSTTQSITLPIRRNQVRKWISNPSSSSRSPASWAEPVRRSSAPWPSGWPGDRRLTAVHRLSRWCHPGPRRIPRGYDPFDHPKRQGTRYVCRSSCPMICPPMPRLEVTRNKTKKSEAY